eukprot:ANDGO_08561.mRNA.1 hypothetical protein
MSVVATDSMFATPAEELATLQSIRKTMSTFHSLLRTIESDLETIAANYEQQTALQKAWAKFLAHQTSS